jgi:hypothetical protein
MSLLKHWREQRATAAEQAEGKLVSFPGKAEPYGRGRSSPENARRPVEERCAEALELVGELIELFNERASILEHDAHLPRADAERLATIEVCATEAYSRWRALE